MLPVYEYSSIMTCGDIDWYSYNAPTAVCYGVPRPRRTAIIIGRTLHRGDEGRRARGQGWAGVD